MDAEVTVYPLSLALNSKFSGQLKLSNARDVTVAYRVKSNVSNMFVIQPEVKSFIAPKSQIDLFLSKRIAEIGTPAPDGCIGKLLFEFIVLPSNVALGKAAIKKFWLSLASDNSNDANITTQMVEVCNPTEESHHPPSSPRSKDESAKLREIEDEMFLAASSTNNPSNSAATASSDSPSTAELQSHSAPEDTSPSDPAILLSTMCHNEALKLLQRSSRPSFAPAQPIMAPVMAPVTLPSITTQSGVALSSRILLLLIKNVSRDDPLSPGETQELTVFRGELSKKQWQECLQAARSEKSQRETTAAQRSSVMLSTIAVDGNDVPPIPSTSSSALAPSPPVTYSPATIGSLVEQGRRIGIIARAQAKQKSIMERASEANSAPTAAPFIPNPFPTSGAPSPHQPTTPRSEPPRPRTPTLSRSPDLTSTPPRSYVSVSGSVSPAVRTTTPTKTVPPAPTTGTSAGASGAKKSSSWKSEPQFLKGARSPRPRDEAGNLVTTGMSASTGSVGNQSEKHTENETSQSGKRNSYGGDDRETSSITTGRTTPKPYTSNPTPRTGSSSAAAHSLSADLTRSTSLRIEAAVSAAKCLIASLEADGIEGIRETEDNDYDDEDGNAVNDRAGNDITACNASPANGRVSSGAPYTTASATFSCLKAIVKSLDKSKETMEHLVVLHDQAVADCEGEDLAARFGQTVDGALDGPESDPPVRTSASTASRNIPCTGTTTGGLPLAEGGLSSLLGGLSGSLPSKATTEHTHVRHDPRWGVGPYVYRGQRVDKALGKVARVCVEIPSAGQAVPHGAHSGSSSSHVAKAGHREQAIRLSIDSLSVDVVWRQQHANLRGGVANSVPRNYPANLALHTGSDTNAHKTYRNANTTPVTVLHRERFEFDDVMAGPTAASQLEAFARHRAKHALLQGTGLAFVCVSAAGAVHEKRLGTTSLDLPIAMMLGEGSKGIASIVVEEVFEFMRPANAVHVATATYPSTKSGYERISRLTTASNDGNYIAAKLAREGQTSRVVVSAVIVVEHGAILDLFAPINSTNKPHTPTPACRVVRHTNGAPYLTHCSCVSIKSSAEFERLLGVLMGRRAMYTELRGEDKGGVDGNSGIAAWVGSKPATMLLTITIAGGSIRTLRRYSQFSFTAAVGESVSQDLCLLTEALACIPAPPPPPLLKSCPLAALLLDSPGHTYPDAVLLVGCADETANASSAADRGTVGRSREKDKVESEMAIQAALQALRLIGNSGAAY